MDRLLAELCELVQSGCSIEAAGKQLGVSKSTAYKMLVTIDIPRRRFRPTTPEERSRIRTTLVRTQLSRREIGRKFQRSASTVQRLANAMVGKVDSRRLRTPRRCPLCGRSVIQWPCVACRVRGD